VRALKAIRPSPATVIASIALLVALAGTGYAATSLPANSVGNKQLQSNAVTSSKVKDHSLLKADFATNVLLRGARGARGPQGLPGLPGSPGARGPTGPTGTAATKWALVGRDGNFVAGSTGIVVVQSGPGQYYVNFGTPVIGHAIVVTPAFRPVDSVSGRGTTIAAICGATGTTPVPDTISCSLNNNTSTVFVVTFNQTNNLAESHGFYIAVL
jgi:hypothetical protein